MLPIFISLAKHNCQIWSRASSFSNCWWLFLLITKLTPVALIEIMFLFNKQMKMGNIKTNTSLLVSSRKIKDRLHVSLWNNLEKNIVIQVRIVILSWINVHCWTKKKKNILFYIVLFLFTFVNFPFSFSFFQLYNILFLIFLQELFAQNYFFLRITCCPFCAPR
jgi:hypothetical protein